jgi:hypothetical protein
LGMGQLPDWAWVTCLATRFNSCPTGRAAGNACAGRAAGEVAEKAGMGTTAGAGCGGRGWWGAHAQPELKPQDQPKRSRRRRQGLLVLFGPVLRPYGAAPRGPTSEQANFTAAAYGQHRRRTSRPPGPQPVFTIPKPMRLTLDGVRRRTTRRRTRADAHAERFFRPLLEARPIPPSAVDIPIIFPSVDISGCESASQD